MPPKKYVLDTNCFIDASCDPKAREAYTAFCATVAPGLYLSAVVGAELRAGTANGRSLLSTNLVKSKLSKSTRKL